MSYIIVPDPHPGRCLNLRYHRHADGSYETLRCLDYEHVAHQCSFPEPRPELPASATGAWASTMYEAKKPEPWVKPDA